MYPTPQSASKPKRAASKEVRKGPREGAERRSRERGPRRGREKRKREEEEKVKSSKRATSNYYDIVDIKSIAIKAILFFVGMMPKVALLRLYKTKKFISLQIHF